jgi:hypothetical protein
VTSYLDYAEKASYAAQTCSIFLDLKFDDFMTSLDAENAEGGDTARKVWHEIHHFWLLSATSFGVRYQHQKNWLATQILIYLSEKALKNDLVLPVKLADVYESMESQEKGFGSKLSGLLQAADTQFGDHAFVKNFFKGVPPSFLRQDYKEPPMVRLEIVDGKPKDYGYATLGVRALVECFSEIATDYLLTPQQAQKRREEFNVNYKKNVFKADYSVVTRVFEQELVGFFDPVVSDIVLLEFIRYSLMITDEEDSPGKRFMILLEQAKKRGRPRKLHADQIPGYLESLCQGTHLKTPVDNYEFYARFCDNLLESTLTTLNLTGVSSFPVLHYFRRFLEPDVSNGWIPALLMKQGRHGIFEMVPPRLVHLLDMLWSPGQEWNQRVFSERVDSYETLRLTNPNPDHTGFVLYSIANQALKNRTIMCPYKYHQNSYRCGCEFEALSDSHTLPVSEDFRQCKCSFLQAWRNLDLNKMHELPLQF